MRYRKRAQATGGNAAILISLIAVAIILYMIFLPTSEREKILLNESELDDNGKSNEIVRGREILLKEFPGTISAVEGVEDEKDLPNVFLLETKNAAELTTINPFIVTASSFNEKTRTEEFKIEDLDNTENVVLSFNVNEREGILAISLNDKIIFENELTSFIVEPVKLSKSDLQEDNVLVFSVDKPGANVFKTNKYSLENIKIVGDITDKSQQESRNLFVLTDSEFDNIEKAELKFIPYCSGVRNVGKLMVEVNNREVFSAIPVCDDPYKQVVPTGVLREGDNSVVFRTEKGSYSVEQVLFNLEFEDARVTPYFFELDQDDIDDINDTTKDLELIVEFVENEDLADIIVEFNGHKRTIDNRDLKYTRELNVNDTRNGNNVIRLIPEQEDIDVLELRVELLRR
tara:strand:+ start:3371 stop:4576 length:1206 start_codon:yes stop_codon:yes gene_type:complete